MKFILCVGSETGPFWKSASRRVYCQDGVHYDEKMRAFFNLVPIKEEVEEGADSREDGSVDSRASSVRSGYSSFNSCRDGGSDEKAGGL